MKHLEYLPSINGFKIIYIPNPEDLNLPFVVSTVGLTGTEGVVNLVRTSKYYLVYSAKGCGKVLINEDWQQLPEGSLLFINRDDHITYQPVDDSSWSTFYLTFNGPVIKSLINISSCVVNDDSMRFFSDFILKAKDKFNDDDFFAFIQGGLLYTLQLLRNSTLDIYDKKCIRPDSSDTQSKISESIRYFTEHFNEDIAVSYLAERCGISTQHYCKFFKQQTGSSPVSYIKSIRIFRACEMLKNEPHLKTYTIAKKCGFENTTYFNKVFKQLTKTTPTEYRNNHKN